MKIMLVADTLWVAESVVPALLTHDREMIEVPDGRDALAIAQGEDIDLVISDMQVGAMGGIAVYRKFHTEYLAGRLYKIPFLLLLDRPQDEHLAQRFGIENTLLKPIDVLELQRITKRLLGSPETSTV